MKDYIIYVAGYQWNVTASSREDAIAQLDESERPWILDVVEVESP